MNLFETEFLFCIISGFFLFHSIIRIAEEWKRRELIFLWTTITGFGFFITESLFKWGIQSELWSTHSIFGYITKSNLLLFLSYVALEERIFTLTPLRRFFVSVFLYLFWVGVLFGIQFFQTVIQVQDTALILPFATALGAFIWSREMFWSFSEEKTTKLGGDSTHLVYLSFLPATFLILSPWKFDVSFYIKVANLFLYGIVSHIGFQLVSKFKKETVPFESEIGIWIGAITFSTCLGTEVLIVLPLAFLSGIFGRLFYVYLSSLSWSEPSLRGVISFLFPAFLGIFLPFLLTEPKDWVHSPYVLLGVQTLYFLSFYLAGAFSFGIILLSKQK